MMEEIIAGITKAHGAQYKLSWLEPNIVTYNDPRAYGITVQACLDAAGTENYHALGGLYFGVEGFFAFQATSSGCCALLGASLCSNAKAAMTQNSLFRVKEDAFSHGIRFHVNAVHRMLIDSVV
ncbi:hypothetical protein CUR178_05911 [Leishmania enriettii]|uniref:Uncharacterized protein n=1 Tax=Leishmania enriettii TaxID=5663 RepID=A0A836HML8_LEIEN|nr:hypothetical protein CUR178_05911 [Leishmania enriettii]